MNRRTFLRTIGLTTASAHILGLVSGCGTTGLTVYRLPRRGTEIQIRIDDFPELAKAGGAVEIVIESQGDSIVVLRTSETEFLALSPICTHLGCTVHKEPGGFRCPCHGSTYALDGTVVRGPAERSLTVYLSNLENNILHIIL